MKDIWGAYREKLKMNCMLDDTNKLMFILLRMILVLWVECPYFREVQSEVGVRVLTSATFKQFSTYTQHIYMHKPLYTHVQINEEIKQIRKSIGEFR